MRVLNKLGWPIRAPCLYTHRMQVTLNGLQFWYDEVVNFPAGHELLREGRKHGSIYLLKQGAVEIIKQGQRITTCDQRGDMFGEVSALTGDPCTTTVRALEPSSFLVVEDANCFLSQNAQTALSVAKMLARRLAATTESHSRQQALLNTAPGQVEPATQVQLMDCLSNRRIYFQSPSDNELMWIHFHSDQTLTLSGTAATPIPFETDGLNVKFTNPASSSAASLAFEQVRLDKGDEFILNHQGQSMATTILMVE